jgi:hypothetical protein
VSGSDEVLEVLLGDIGWREDRRQMYEREVAVPRLLRWYSGTETLPHPLLTEARESLNRYYAPELGERFVSAGMCLYRDGRDSVAWHGDRIGRGRSSDTMVAIVSFGSPRPLMLRPVGGGESLRFPLGHGDLVVSAPGSTASPRRPSPSALASACSSAPAGSPEHGVTEAARHPAAERLSTRVWFSMRRADRKVCRASPPSAGPLETGVVLDIQPAGKPVRVELLRVRSLRTQQRAESQCQVIPRVVARAVAAGIPLVD